MDQAEIAGRLAELHGILEGTRRRGRLFVIGAALLSACVAWLATGTGLWALAALAAAGGAGSVLLWWRGHRTRRQLAALERAYPEQVALAMDRYRLARAVARAERWKVFR